MLKPYLTEVVVDLIDADMRARKPVIDPRDVARRVVERLGESVASEGALRDLARRILKARFGLKPG